MEVGRFQDKINNGLARVIFIVSFISLKVYVYIQTVQNFSTK